jgi:hypothetical protein
VYFQYTDLLLGSLFICDGDNVILNIDGRHFLGQENLFNVCWDEAFVLVSWGSLLKSFLTFEEKPMDCSNKDLWNLDFFAGEAEGALSLLGLTPTLVWSKSLVREQNQTHH